MGGQTNKCARTSSWLFNIWPGEYVSNDEPYTHSPPQTLASVRVSMSVHEKEGTKEGPFHPISTTHLSTEGEACMVLSQVPACGILCWLLGEQEGVTCQLPVCQSCYILPQGIFLYKLPLLWPREVSPRQNALFLLNPQMPQSTWLDQSCGDPGS